MGEAQILPRTRSGGEGDRGQGAGGKNYSPSQKSQFNKHAQSQSKIPTRNDDSFRNVLARFWILLWLRNLIADENLKRRAGIGLTAQAAAEQVSETGTEPVVSVRNVYKLFGGRE